MRVHYFQHVPFEGLGSIAHWLSAKGIRASGTHFYSNWKLPEMDDFDLLIIMGGPMSCNDERHYPWLAAEKSFIKLAMAEGKAILGICLGAQLIAAALGMRVYPNPVKEIGWFEVYGKTPGAPTAFSLPQKLKVLHWHGETFDLPENAILLASSRACSNQAFQIGEKILGLQFHLETTEESLASLTSHCQDELIPGPTIESKTRILGNKGGFKQINQLMENILDYLAKRCI